MPVALDELLAQGKPWEPIPQLRALVLKPTLLGAWQHEALVARARELKLKVIVSSCFESVSASVSSPASREWAPDQALASIPAAGWPGSAGQAGNPIRAGWTPCFTVTDPW
jgi:hypothetical protein